MVGNCSRRPLLCYAGLCKWGEGVNSSWDREPVEDGWYISWEDRDLSTGDLLNSFNVLWANQWAGLFLTHQCDVVPWFTKRTHHSISLFLSTMWYIVASHAISWFSLFDSLEAVLSEIFTSITKNLTFTTWHRQSSHRNIAVATNLIITCTQSIVMHAWMQ